MQPGFGGPAVALAKAGSPSEDHMKPFMDEGFLLESDVASDLYHRFAETMPIIDFHCHLSPQLMAEDHRFRSITEIWLDGDHYKWRAMRADGVPERYCTGDASDWEKFEAWARTVPHTVRNPQYHWTHMELRKPFGVHDLLSPTTAKSVYDRCNARLAEDGFTAMGLLRGFRVAVVCSTDDPVDSLDAHRALARRTSPDTRVYPTWRPDKALAIDDPAAFNGYVSRLEEASGIAIGGSFAAFVEALEARHGVFHSLGCRASDHGLEAMFSEPWEDAEVNDSFERVRAGKAIDAGRAIRFKAALLYHLAVLDHARGWVQQYHLGALRNNNSRLKRALGPDTGFDSVGDFEMGRSLSRFLDRLDESNQLAKTILYNLNPRDNELFATMIGNFQDGSVPGKMQYGSAWWFLDQLDGMTAQINTLSNLGLLARFVGMVTDSRSFLSYSRHEYFRRLLCNLLGEDVTRGRLPDDRELLGEVVRGVCFVNAKQYFGFEMGRAAETA
jgi:glucuronate isomerase